MKLNESQALVVRSRERRLLVLAGAGTGKTATSVHWVADLVASGVKRREILMITFTRKAASEMAKRVENLIRHIPRHSEKDRITVGTYHAVASILLREDAKPFGLFDHTFSTIDESETQSIWKSALKQCGIPQKSALFAPGRLHELYSLSRNTCIPVAEVLQPVFKGNAKKLLKVVDAYEELKRAANVVDYDDLLVLWNQRLARDAAYAEKLRTRWPYVLVDEMQDNNRLNEGILLAMNPQHLMVVGDANQSIYGFRGSDVRLISEFPVKNQGATILKLEDNYRSGQPILDLANEVVAKSEAALNLRSSSGREGRVMYRCYLNPEDEAYAVVQWIQTRLLAGKKGEDNAILARSSRALTALELALNYHHIRYKKYGGLMLADAAEVKDFISFLRVSHNSRDKIALLRALTQFPGIGEGTAAKVISSQEGGLFAEDLWPEAAMELPQWILEIKRLPDLAAKGRFLQEKIKELVLANYPKDGEERLGTIQALVNSMEGQKITLAEFLDGFTLSRQTNDFHPEEAVVLSTIHSSKGLEWDGVWIVGGGASQMPHPRVENGEGDIEEERRLFYVAVTRARHDLVISYPATTERKQRQNPSPFVPAAADWQFTMT